MDHTQPTKRNSREAGEAAPAHRSTREVFEDHLQLRAKGDLERDIHRNYAKNVVLMHVNGVEHGHAGVRKSGGRLHRQLPGCHYEYVSKQVTGDYAYLEWRARSERYRVADGADSFVIQGGKIVMQTIHYTLKGNAD
ncbi:MAG TPA: nuclear transport factor 2 family protein [Trueperaceae bacterium]